MLDSLGNYYRSLRGDVDQEFYFLDGPGLGLEPDTDAVREYLQTVEIVVDGRVLYTTPEL